MVQISMTNSATPNKHSDSPQYVVFRTATVYTERLKRLKWATHFGIGFYILLAILSFPIVCGITHHTLENTWIANGVIAGSLLIETVGILLLHKLYNRSNAKLMDDFYTEVKVHIEEMKKDDATKEYSSYLDITPSDYKDCN